MAEKEEIKISKKKSELAGVIIDKNNGEVLEGAKIFLKEKPEIGTYSDSKGKYFLEAPEGTYTLVISYIGYKTKEITDVTFKLGILRLAPITLQDESYRVETVENFIYFR